MLAKFPTTEIFKQSIQLPFSNVGGIFASIGMFIGGIIVAGIFLAITMAVIGFDPEALENLAQNLQAGQFDGLGTLVIGYLIAFVAALVFIAHIFNYWVNFAAFGKEEARWSFAEGRFAAAITNGLKLLLISMLILLINFAVTFVLSSLGLVPSFSEQLGITDITESILAPLTGSIVMVVISCIVYSIFSANLTQTALRSDAEGLEHPHNVDFAIVLVMLYAFYLVPTVIAALTGSAVLTYIVSFLLTLHFMFTVPIAHGLRYRVCMAEKSEDGVV
jgi:hypothetical protein